MVGLAILVIYRNFTLFCLSSFKTPLPPPGGYGTTFSFQNVSRSQVRDPRPDAGPISRDWPIVVIIRYLAPDERMNIEGRQFLASSRAGPIYQKKISYRVRDTDISYRIAYLKFH